ncbi:MAG TPA: glycogen synthase GlgA [Gammaproteobacteria bacterium]|nr:glycogen synthase GlgA [Gammaproteobacteria bacterium]
MNVLMVSAELAPFAKTGGLADAVTGLSDALAARGHDVRVLLPKYAHLPPANLDATPLATAVGGRSVLEIGAPKARRARGGRRKRGVPTVYLLDLEELTPGPIYHGDDRDAGRFLRLTQAAVDLPAALAWRPDVLHCHDWHAALVPLAQRAQAPARPVPTILTLHNIGYQGLFGDAVLTRFGFDALRPFVPPDALTGGTVNFLRAGLHAADAVTTVSPTYAREIRTAVFGMGLEDVLNARPDDVVGILNGVDYDLWGPEKDPFLAFHYDASNLTPKQSIKRSLAEAVGLSADSSGPLLGVVSRLAPQKGVDLVAAVLPELLATTRASFVCLGSGDAVLATALRALADASPQRVAFVEGYDESLAHAILAGADIALVPSRYEPCGLTQMYALRYGTIPVVRATGGLADTIQHFDPATGAGNGSVFRDADAEGLLWGIRSALSWFDDPAAWARVTANAMAADFSWRNQTGQYETLYRSLSAEA